MKYKEWFKIMSIFSMLLVVSISYSQETLPVYADYLTDNIYLIHPTGAGINNYGKLRLTARKQWMQQKGAPELQTLSFQTHFGEESAMGIIIFNDNNGHFSNAGGYLTYAYHIALDDYTVNQLSFGLSIMALRNTLDGSDFNLHDSDVQQEVINESYFNADFGMAYKNQGFFTFYTAKNLFLFERPFLNNQLENSNQRRHLFTIGYFFNHDEEDYFKVQPSLMAQYIEQSKEMFLDINMKLFAPLSNGNVWGGASYRKGIDTYNYETPNYLTAFIGFNLDNFVFSYAYTQQVNKHIFVKGASHQISIGYNMYIERTNVSQPTWSL
jgi:type IX secretion system PorP/SprF family membrane protein